MHQVGFGQKRKVFSMNEMHAEPLFPWDYVTSRNNYCICIMISTVESKHVFKNHKLHKKWRWSYNVISAFNWSGMYIWYIYMILKYPVWWQKLLLVGSWWGQGIISHMVSHAVWWKKKGFCCTCYKTTVTVYTFAQPLCYRQNVT